MNLDNRDGVHSLLDSEPDGVFGNGEGCPVPNLLAEVAVHDGGDTNFAIKCQNVAQFGIEGPNLTGVAAQAIEFVGGEGA